MNWILFLFIFLTITTCLTWQGKYRLGIIFFLVFLLAALIVFFFSITDHIPIQL